MEFDRRNRPDDAAHEKRLRDRPAVRDLAAPGVLTNEMAKYLVESVMNPYPKTPFPLTGAAAAYATDLARAIENDPEGWVHTFAAGRRDECITMLMYILAHEKVLHEYQHCVHRLPDVSALEEKHGGEYPFEEAVRTGLGVLTDEQLAVASAFAPALDVFEECLIYGLREGSCGRVWLDALSAFEHSEPVFRPRHGPGRRD